MSYDLTLKRGVVEDDETTLEPLDEGFVRAALQQLGVEDAGEEAYWQVAGLVAVFYLLPADDGLVYELGVELHSGEDERRRRPDAERLFAALAELAEAQRAQVYDLQTGGYLTRESVAESVDCFAGPDEEPRASRDAEGPDGPDGPDGPEDTETGRRRSLFSRLFS